MSDSDESSQIDAHVVAAHREHVDGYDERDPDAYPHAGTVRDADLSRALAMIEQDYDPHEAENPEQMPGSARDLALVEDIRRVEATEHARRALENGDAATLQHQMGNTNQRADVSGIQAFETLKSFMRGPAPMFYEWAEPGTGKTNFALFLGQLWKRDNPNGLVASNIRTLKETDEWSPEGDVDAEEGVVRDPETGDVLDAEPRDGWLSNFGELEEWMQQDGAPIENEQTPKLFIFDEASSNAGGSGGDGYQTKQKMGPLAYKIRKYGGSLIVIGHDGKDVHPLIREMGVCIHKEGLRTATFYEDVKNRSGVGEIETIEGIPETDWRYYDEEATTWSWSRGDEDDGLDEETKNRYSRIAAACLMRDNGVSNSDAAESVDRSVGWVSERYNEYRDGEHTEAMKYWLGETA